MTEKKHSVLNIVRIVVAIVLTLFFVAIVALGALAASGSMKIANIPYTLFEVTSDSMYPKIHNGDGIIETNTPYTELQIGDIITIYQNGEFITHEIVDITDGTVTTKGSANIYEDVPITAESYAGKVVFIIPGFSIFLEMTSGWKKAIWIAAILFVLFVPEAIVKLSESRRRKRMAN